MIFTRDTVAVEASVELAGQSNTSVSMPLPGITVHPTEIVQIAAAVTDTFKMFAKRLLVTSFSQSAFVINSKECYHLIATLG